MRRVLLMLMLPAVAACATSSQANLPALPTADVLAEAYYQHQNAGCVALIDACEDWMYVNGTTTQIGEIDCLRASRNVANCRFVMIGRFDQLRDECRIALDWGQDLGGRSRWLTRRAKLSLAAYVPQLDCRTTAD